MIDDTVKDILRAARDATTLDTLRTLRARVDDEVGDRHTGAGFVCMVAIDVREQAILESYKFDIANEAS